MNTDSDDSAGWQDLDFVSRFNAWLLTCAVLFWLGWFLAYFRGLDLLWTTVFAACFALLPVVWRKRASRLLRYGLITVAAAVFLAGCADMVSFVHIEGSGAAKESPRAAQPVKQEVPVATLTPTLPAPVWVDQPGGDMAAPTPLPTLAPVCTVTTGWVGGTVNVRSGAGMNYPVVDVVNEGDKLFVLYERLDRWAEVGTPNGRGWFYLKWCEEYKESRK